MAPGSEDLLAAAIEKMALVRIFWALRQQAEETFEAFSGVEPNRTFFGSGIRSTLASDWLVVNAGVFC